MSNVATRPAPKTVAQPVPAGYHTITPALVVKDAARAIEFYKKALGATLAEEPCSCAESGKIMHASLRVGDSNFFLSDEMPQMGCLSAPASQYLYVNDCDAAFKRAVDAGATAKYPVADMFWGDRLGAVTDPFGHTWTIATHKQDLTIEEVKAGQKAFAEKMKAQGGGCSK
ncbi:MAG: VOC family protein [Planctomycetes bacterium]|nr:VOC family protein [Planctomycetota bacterium]